MSEEAAAAIDADAARDKSSCAKSGKPMAAGNGEANGYHDMDGAADGHGEGLKEVDASQVAEKVKCI